MSTLANSGKTAVFTLLVPVVVAGAIPQEIVRATRTSQSLLARVLGLVLVLLGTAGYLWCATLFVQAQGTPAPVAPTRRAVVSGPYRINRNPMYTSVLAVIFGQALLYGSVALAVYGLVLFLFFEAFVILYEERVLRRTFNGEYDEFCRRVPRWIPWPRA